MFGLFKSNPAKHLKRKHSLKLKEAMLAQRKGDIRTYSQLSLEAEQILVEIERIEKGG